MVKVGLEQWKTILDEAGRRSTGKQDYIPKFL